MIRHATPEDVPAIHAMVRELAAYERAPQEARATEEQLREALFGPDAVASALIAVPDGAGGQEGAVSPEPAGFALWFRNFSTWIGKPGMYLEDLYVRPDVRGEGHGKALLAALAAICVERGFERFEWTVLDWNEKALGVYRSVGALPQDQWTVQRLSGPALHALAARAGAVGDGSVSTATGATIRSSNQAPTHAH
ncbi:L-amino acid N-acyltransferase YncA [Actinacidiphila yanglinensis]|uniref:L-amino acid N-acyltransferase YncA n=1 Tax=Actinacidiphila yanglinensis TaxID=310779 RepID=A0A1H5VGG1_9ACTN|nr:GNAT family N-acetyltransferase [Actinacidiphila yanglinensis]SEF86136.1 L-amino acid N-acyltransferase YncA [Actinacidiphila yanglinensis]